VVIGKLASVPKFTSFGGGAIVWAMSGKSLLKKLLDFLLVICHALNSERKQYESNNKT
jgi:hypothetical protein